MQWIFPPGRYTIEVDPAQLDFLSARMPEGPVEFEIRALSEGDFVEDLDLFMVPLTEEIPAEKETRMK